MQLFDVLRKKYDSFTLMKDENFLQRKTNSFDNNIPLVLYDVKDSEETVTKLKKLFGNPEIEENGDYLIVTPQEFMKRTKYSFGDLVEVIKRLRDKDGCPWDRKQTNMTIRDNVVEEAYELAEAVEMNDTEKMLEESGDVILQGLFHAVIAEEDNRFSAVEVISELCKKLISRHTHIFGEYKANNSEDALKCWEEAKEKEKGQKCIEDKLNSVPKTFGSAMRANKVQKIVKRTGFEFPSIEEAEKKIYEEIEELKKAKGVDVEKEAGDLLFSVINYLRMLDIDPEVALNGTTNRFIKRFLFVEKKAKEEGKRLEECVLDEMENWYQQGKQFE